MAIMDRQSERIVLRRACTYLKSRGLTATARALEKEARFRRIATKPAVTTDRQSEWVVLRRLCAFLESRGLEATAYALEKEARLRFDLRRVSRLLKAGRWRLADEYVSAFLGDTGTPAASTALFVVRLQRFADALRRGDTTWARGYLDRRVQPVLANHPNGAAAWAYCLRALGSDVESLVQDIPGDARDRLRCVQDFMRWVNYNPQLQRCKLSFFNDEGPSPMRVQGGTATLGLRRHGRTRRCRAGKRRVTYTLPRTTD